MTSPAMTGRAAAVALAGVLLIVAVRSAVTVAVIDGVLLAAILADLLLAVPPRAVQLARSGPVKLRLGESVPVVITIINPQRRVLIARVRDAWPPSAGATGGAATVRVPPGGQASVTVTLTPERRGDLTSELITLRSFGPLGLAARQRGTRVRWTVRALPPFRSRRQLPGKLARLRELDGQHRSVLPGQGSEFDSLREYVIGDDVRSVDWRSTARRGDVMVRTWRPERDRRVVLILDTGRTSAGRVAGYPRLDAAMDAVQMLTALASRAGDRVDLIAADRQVRARVLGPPRSGALAAVTDAMAALEPALVETDGQLLASTVLTHARRRCLVVALTDLTVPGSWQPIAARHELLIGSVTDPRVSSLAAGRGDAASVYAAAAAASALASRGEAAAALVRSGATVVDAPPDRLPAALADAYLALKTSGRL